MAYHLIAKNLLKVCQGWLILISDNLDLLLLHFSFSEWFAIDILVLDQNKSNQTLKMFSILFVLVHYISIGIYEGCDFLNENFCKKKNIWFSYILPTYFPFL